MCLSVKHGLLFVSVRSAKRIQVYMLADGLFAGSVECEGNMCITPGDDSLLVTEYDNHRVQEFRVLGGESIRCIGEGHLRYPDQVACNTAVLAVSEAGGRVSLFSWRDKSLQRRVSLSGAVPGGICLLRDSSGFVVADGGRRHQLDIFRLDGELVNTIHMEQHARAALECQGGFIVAHYWEGSLAKISRPGGEVLGVSSSQYGPNTLVALPDGGLALREFYCFKLFYGLDLRRAWLQTCAACAVLLK